MIAFCAVLASGLVRAEDGVNGACLDCHTDAGYLMQTVAPPPSSDADSCAAAPTRPPFLSSFVNPAFPSSTHGQLGCTACHGGDADTKDADSAHSAMTPATGTCADCHEEVAQLYATSLHNTLGGMAHALKLRSGKANFHKLDQMWANDCATCHASCADCHLSLPAAVGGGLIKGHEFFKRPPMKDTCAVCHGSRAGGEYLGSHEGLQPDVHFKAGMHCLDCHKNDLHGDGQNYTDRWQVQGRPLCTDCHPALPNDQVREHSEDHLNVSCQVCHAQPYQNCFACHSEITDQGYKRQAGHKEWNLKVGDNTVDGYPYDIVTVRKNPVARNSFASFGPDLLPYFDDRPTWKTAAPHNIVRDAAQSKRCSGCHDSDQLYLNKPNSLDP
ncbi:hypothetical protein ACFL12_00975 [Pseudomonadota bacterium]